MKNLIIERIKQAKKALDDAWEGYNAEKDPKYQDLYISDIGKARRELSRLESLLVELEEIENKLRI